MERSRTIAVPNGLSTQAIRDAAAETAEELLIELNSLGHAEVEITVRPARPRAQRARSIEAVQLAVCQHFDLQLTALSSRDRGKGAAFPRHIAMYLCKHLLETSFPEIGRAFGGRDHTTVMSAVRSVAKQRVTFPRVREVLAELELELGGEPSGAAASVLEVFDELTERVEALQAQCGEPTVHLRKARS